MSDRSGAGRMPRLAAPAVLALALLVACHPDHAPLAYDPGPDQPGPHRSGGRIVLTREEDPDFMDPGLSYGV
jgi:hypothetical protein